MGLCPRGYRVVVTASLSRCEACPAGTFSVGGRRENCLPCPLNFDCSNGTAEAVVGFYSIEDPRLEDEDGDGVIVVSDEVASVYGEGETDAEAVQDYLENLDSQFLYLEEHEHRLAPGLLAELTSLRQHMMRAS